MHKFVKSLNDNLSSNFAMFLYQLLSLILIVGFPILISGEIIGHSHSKEPDYWNNNPALDWIFPIIHLFLGIPASTFILIRGKYDKLLLINKEDESFEEVVDEFLKKMAKSMRWVYFLVTVVGSILISYDNLKRTGTIMAIGATVQDRFLEKVEKSLEENWITLEKRKLETEQKGIITKEIEKIRKSDFEKRERKNSIKSIKTREETANSLSKSEDTIKRANIKLDTVRQLSIMMVMEEGRGGPGIISNSNQSLSNSSLSDATKTNNDECTELQSLSSPRKNSTISRKGKEIVR
jgi:hypothetical protein